jgi:hypothetical protein
MLVDLRRSRPGRLSKLRLTVRAGGTAGPTLDLAREGATFAGFLGTEEVRIVYATFAETPDRARLLLSPGTAGAVALRPTLPQISRQV